MKHILQKFLPLALALALLSSLAPAVPAADADGVLATGVTLSSEDGKLADDGKTPPSSYTLDLISSGAINHTATLTATVGPPNVDEENKDVTWSIDEKGREFAAFVVDGERKYEVTTKSGESVTVEGLAKGKAAITVTADGGEKDKDGNSTVKTTCAVNVTDFVHVTRVTLSPTTLKLVSEGKINNTATLTATIEPSDATNKNVTWGIYPDPAGAGCVTEDKTVKRDETGLTYAVQGIGVGAATIVVTTEDGGKTATCAVTVSEPVGVEGVTLSRTSLSMDAGTTASLTATVKPGEATDKSVKWAVEQADNENPTIVLDKETTQSGSSVTVTARKTGSATVIATTGDGTQTARCEITITTPRITISMDDDEDRLSFYDSGLLSTLRSYCRNITGSSLSYLTSISISTAQGTLYEGYVSEADHGEGVSSSMRYYDSGTGANQLSKVIFVPRTGFTGSATITFTAYAVSGAVFTGSIVISIPDDPLSYTAENGLPVCFKAADFTNYSLTRGYSTVRYVRFYDLPYSSEGALYYNYIDSDINEGRVSSSTAYYRTGSPSLDKVWFVPNPNYSGNVTIPFEACDTAGATFTGSLVIQVVNVAGDSGAVSTISYSVRPGETLWFSTNDFNDLSYDLTDYPLNYLRFTSLPASSRGTLYCSGYGSLSTDQYLYRSGSNRRLLFDVYFTARSNYTGTVSIPFTAYATNGRSFRGTVSITVSSSAGSTGPVNQTIYDTGSMITYSSGGEAVAFRVQDFYNEASRHLSNPLSTVEFYTPDAAQGRLCLNYVSPTSYSVLDSSVKYSYALTSQISFLPRAGFSGAAYIRYIATDVSGKGYTGTLAVNVTPPASSGYFNDLGGYSWAVPATDFLARYGIVNGVDYRAFSPSGLTKRGDFILMLQRCFDFQSVADVPVFSDVPVWSYYGPAIVGAYVAGLVTGDGDGSFRPDAALTRQEAAVLLYRCLRRSGSLPAVTAADLEGFADRWQIADYAQTAAATLARLGVLTGSGGYLNPTQDLTRAEMALMFYRALT